MEEQEQFAESADKNQEPPQERGSNGQEQQLTKKQRKALKKQKQQEERAKVARARKAKKWLAWLIVIVIIILGIWWLGSRSGSSGSVASVPETEITNQDWTKGSSNPSVEIIEYSDFQCPACASFFPIVKQLTEEFGDSVQFAYRHYPLRTIHANAEKGARAAEAAGVQGNFWGMHDTLFQRQNEWSNVRNPFDLFSNYAQQLGLDTAQFETDYNSREAKDKVRAHEAAGRRLGVNGTPTFLLNGERIPNPNGVHEFRSILVGLVGEPNTQDEEQTATTTQDSLEQEEGAEITE
jgi:protein-disulfide isomerase